MHFGVAPSLGSYTLSAVASKWAVIKKLKMLRLVKDCLGHRFHVKILPQKLSQQRGEPISLYECFSSFSSLFSIDAQYAFGWFSRINSNSCTWKYCTQYELVSA